MDNDNATPPADDGQEEHAQDRQSTREIAPPADDARAQEAAFLADFALLITTLSHRFINIGWSAIDEEVSLAIEMVGSFARVDRSYIFQFSPDGDHIVNTHEWCEDDIEPVKPFFQEATVDDYAWALNRLMDGEPICVNDIADLPPEAADWKRSFADRDRQSVLNVALACSGKTLGFIGLDTVGRQENWSPSTIKLLKVAADLIAGAIERARSTELLTHRVALEKLVVGISTRFVNLDGKDMDAAICRTIEEIARFTKANRGCVFRLADPATLTNTHEWHAPDLSPLRELLQEVPTADIPYAMGRLSQGEILRIPAVDDLPPEAASEKAQFKRLGVDSLVYVPILHQGTMIGVIGLSSTDAAKTWSEEDFGLLKLVGEIFAGAFERRRTEERLHASLREKEVLLREVHHRVKNNLQIIHGLLYLSENALGNQASSDAVEAFRLNQHRIKAMAVLHDRLYSSTNLAHIDIGAYLQMLLPKLIASYGAGDRLRLVIDAKDALLDIDQAIPCSLIVNEAVANSLKHSFPDNRKGRIRVALEDLHDGSMELTIEDDGIGYPRAKDRSPHDELGMQLINDLVDQLEGTMFLDKVPSTRFTIQFEKTIP